MITVKSQSEIQRMRAAGAVLRDTLNLVQDMVKPGVTTAQLCDAAAAYIAKQGGKPSFLGYNGYPAAVCISVDEVVVHGIPSGRRLEEGEIVGVDVGVFLNGYHADAARTFAAGNVSPLKAKLIQTAREAFFKGLAVIREGARLGDIGHAVQTHTEKSGFSVVRSMVGHGIGAKLHEDPEVPNYGTAGRGLRLKSGMTLAIEPMINAGGWAVKVLEDNWTCVTADGSPSAHYENTVLVTPDGAEMLTESN